MFKFVQLLRRLKLTVGIGFCFVLHCRYEFKRMRAICLPDETFDNYICLVKTNEKDGNL